MFNIRLLIILGFKRGLFNLKIRIIYIKIFNILNGFKLEFKAKTKVFKNRCGLIIKGLIKAFIRLFIYKEYSLISFKLILFLNKKIFSLLKIYLPSLLL
jgi:hypothetical protein